MRPLVTDAPTTAVHPSHSAPLSFHACYTFNDHLNVSTTNRRQTPPESRARGGQSESDALSERTHEIPSALLSFWNHQISIEWSVFSEIYNQASLLPFYYLLWGKWLQCLGAPAEEQWRWSAKIKTKQSLQSIHQLLRAAKVRPVGDCSLDKILLVLVLVLCAWRAQLKEQRCRPETAQVGDEVQMSLR